MTYYVLVEIRCDAPRCNRRIGFDRTNEGGLSKTWAGYLASMAGWQMPGGGTTRANPKQAFCPLHRK